MALLLMCLCSSPVLKMMSSDQCCHHAVNKRIKKIFRDYFLFRENHIYPLTSKCPKANGKLRVGTRRKTFVRDTHSIVFIYRTNRLTHSGARVLKSPKTVRYYRLHRVFLLRDARWKKKYVVSELTWTLHET